jgi:hypothetical protein
MLEIRNNLNAERGHESPQAVRFRADVTQLRAEAKEYKDSIAALKRDVAFYIAHLDLAEDGVRVYTCRHHNLQNIVDDQNATREKDAGIIANELFSRWETDAQFMKEYNSMRQHVLDHHRSHEYMKPGRGDASGYIKDEFVRVDHRRGVAMTYT